MKNTKKLGVWMDHSNAFIMELKNDTIVTSIVESEYSHQESQTNIYKGEKLIHKKEQHLQLSYYKKLGEIIRNYDDVILFGPTDAKNELFNLIKNDHLFTEIAIKVKQSDKLSEQQMQTFVREYFM
jgi:hypothetical protein